MLRDAGFQPDPLSHAPEGAEAQHMRSKVHVCFIIRALQKAWNTDDALATRHEPMACESCGARQHGWYRM